MKTSPYSINDVLWIRHKDTEQVARVAGYIDSLDDTKPILVNLRISDGQAWGRRQVKIQPSQIVCADPDWQKRRDEQWEAELKQHCDEMYAKMTPAQKREIHRQAVDMGLADPEPRSPIDILLERVVWTRIESE